MEKTYKETLWSRRARQELTNGRLDRSAQNYLGWLEYIGSDAIFGRHNRDAATIEDLHILHKVWTNSRAANFIRRWLPDLYAALDRVDSALLYIFIGADAEKAYNEAVRAAHEALFFYVGKN